LSEIMLKRLEEQEASCLIYNNEELLYTSNFIGVKPLLDFMEQYPQGFTDQKLVLVDKVIGKAALLLSSLIGIQDIYTPLASCIAVDSATLHNVALYAESVVPYIKNRDNTGMCPLEQSVIGIDDPVLALEKIREAIAILMKNK
jgi:hypothetical protein